MFHGIMRSICLKPKEVAENSKKMEGFTIVQRKNVCDNNCEPIKSVVETLTNGSNCFKYADLFEGAGGLATIPLHKHMDYCCTPFKNRKELFEALDRLRKNNSESTVFEENEIEMILYRMFSSDYSSSFNIDGIATDDFGKQFVIVFLDDNQDTNLTCTIDSNGMLKSKEDPEKYKNCFSKERKLKKDHIRDLLKQIAILNSDINDLSIFNETTDEEYWKEKQEVYRLKEEVWKLYVGEHHEGEYHAYTQINEVETVASPTSNNTPKKKKQQKKKATGTSEKPMTIKYYKHGNNGLLKEQRGRVDILYRKWTEWKWIDKDTRPEDFDRLFEGSPCHCNIAWTGTSTTLTILLQELLKQNFVERQTRCTAKNMVATQFGRTANSSKSRLDEETKRRIYLSIIILDTSNPLPQRNAGNAEEDIQNAALYEIFEGKLRSTKGI